MLVLVIVGANLLQDDSGKWFQIGIVSGGIIGELKCGSMTLPSFYARIGNYTNWIVDNISKVPSNPITPLDFLLLINMMILTVKIVMIVFSEQL